MPKDTLPPVKEALQGDVDMVKELHKELAKATEDLIPVLRLYMEDIRSVRMAIVTEVREILRSSRELGELSKMAPQIHQFGESVAKLNHALTPELKEFLGKLSNE